MPRRCLIGTDLVRTEHHAAEIAIIEEFEFMALHKAQCRRSAVVKHEGPQVCRLR